MNERSRRMRQAQIRRKRKRIKKLLKICMFLFVFTVVLLTGKKVVTALPLGNGIGNEASREDTINAFASNQTVAAPIVYSREEALEQIQSMSSEDGRYTTIVENEAIYPDALLKDLANNQEMLNYVLAYPKDENVAGSIKLTKKELSASCPLFLQWDQRWGYQAYGEDNIAISGCGPTALSMVIVGLTHNQEATPARVAEFASANDYYVVGTGTKWALMTEGAANYGLSSEEIPNDEGAMKDALNQDAFLICSMTAGDFTTAGHFIVVCGSGEDGFEVNDPFCAYRSAEKWSYERLQPQIVGMWQFGKRK